MQLVGDHELCVKFLHGRAALEPERYRDLTQKGQAIVDTTVQPLIYSDAH